MESAAQRLATAQPLETMALILVRRVIREINGVWHSGFDIDDPSASGFDGVSCPSLTSCVAVGAEGADNSKPLFAYSRRAVTKRLGSVRWRSEDPDGSGGDSRRGRERGPHDGAEELNTGRGGRASAANRIRSRRRTTRQNDGRRHLTAIPAAAQNGTYAGVRGASLRSRPRRHSGAGRANPDPSNPCAQVTGSINGSGCTDGTIGNAHGERTPWMGPRIARPEAGVVAPRGRQGSRWQGDLR
jgi:hypothetical protein